MRFLTKKIRDIMTSPMKKKEILRVVGLYLLSLLAGLFIAGLCYAFEYGF
jgi:hypothetical protein